MDQQQQITLKIPTARQKLFPNFPKDPRSDITLVFKQKVFYLSKAFLRLQSGYFKKVCASTVTIHEIKQNFNDTAFQKLLSCFYGAAIQIKRSQFGIYYAIIRFLQIQYLLSFLRKDVRQNIQCYDIFTVMKIAHSYSDQQLFQCCLQQLQKQSFQQLKYHLFQLMETQLSLFKLIIKAHNRHKSLGKTGLPYTEINKLLKDYCDDKNAGEDAYRALKFELIDKTVLTSKQYKQIFLDDAIRQKSRTASNLVGDYPTNQSIIVNGSPVALNKLDTSNLSQSLITPTNHANYFSVNPPPTKNISQLGYSSISNLYSQNNQGVSHQLTLQMQNIFQQKRNQQLVVENKKLQQSFHNLKKLTQENQLIHHQREQQVKYLQQQLLKKIQQRKKNQRQIINYQKIASNMQKDLNVKDQQISKLTQIVQQLKKKKIDDSEDQAQTQQSKMFAESQFLPAHLIGQLMSENLVNKNKSTPITQPKQQKKKDYQNMDEQDLQQLYMPRLKFDIQPISTPKYNLPKLSLFISGKGFSKQILNLIYRRSTTQSPIGKNIDIRQKNSLLILINTVSGQNVGGFVSVPIPKTDIDYIQDKGAFLFTLTKNQKFKIKKSQASQAIFMSDQYLISFANDLMISNQCLKQKSQCSWPSSYQSAKNIKQRGSIWFVSETPFLIKDLQIYQMKQQQMEMVLFD